MQFYKIEDNYRKPDWKKPQEESDMKKNVEEERSLRCDIAEKTAAFNAKLGGNKAVYLALKIGRCAVSRLTFVAMVQEEQEVLPLVKTFAKELGFKKNTSSTPEVSEISFEETARRLSEADRNNFVLDDEEFFNSVGLIPLIRRCECGGINFKENIIESRSYEELEELASRYMIDEDFLPELKRINDAPAKNGKRIQGHPVHYVIKTDNLDIRRESCRMLLSALYAAGRIINKRYTFMDFDPDDNVNEHALETLYKTSAGGSIIIRYTGAGAVESEYAGSERGLIEVLGHMANKYRHKVLTIVCFPKECTRVKELFYEMMPDMRTIEIEEELVRGEKAEKYLQRLCSEQHVRPNKALYAKLSQTENYRGPELEHIFAEWYDGKIRKDCFPQYKEIASTREKTAKAAPKGSAYDELMEMIGLDSAKKVINDALNYFKAQKVFADKGMKVDRPSMHMVFTGNPGSAKTTVARLFAQILRDNNILSKGTFIECGRADLVGKFVGHTAPLVKSKFKEAEGGVLFIDEAYSLVDDRDGSFGDECLAAICQESEVHRDDVMVIFAGYPDKMEGFLAKNPGLRSRIAFNVSFEDYNTEELLDIANLISNKKGISLTLGARQKLRKIFDAERENTDFGNGRFVRNILEKARMSQATRLLQMDLASVTKTDLATISEEDISEPAVKTTVEKHNAIGFCS